MITPQITRTRYTRTRRSTTALSNSLQRWLLVDGRLEPVRAGRLLLVLQGILVLASSRLLSASATSTADLLLISAVMAVVLVGSFGLDWAKLPAIATALFPAATILAFLAIGVQTATTFAPVTGFLTLSFVYVGLTQPGRISFALTPLAGVALAANYGTFTTAIAIRTLVAMSVWLTIALVLTWLKASNAAAADALRRSAHLDGLTGVFNRRDLDLRLADLPGGETIIICDIDHFKRINDTDGHAAGDDVLRRFGKLLRSELRAEDYCARLGGEEFVLILPRRRKERSSGAARPPALKVAPPATGCHLLHRRSRQLHPPHLPSQPGPCRSSPLPGQGLRTQHRPHRRRAESRRRVRRLTCLRTRPVAGFEYECYVSNSIGNIWTHVTLEGTGATGWVYDGDLNDNGSTYAC